MIVAGGILERSFAAFLFICAATTYVLNASLGWSRALPYVTVVDTILLAVVLVIVAKSKRHWPIWFAGFHAVAVATGFAQLFFPNETPGIYIMMAGFWSLPALIAAAIGVFLDKRAKGLGDG